MSLILVVIIIVASFNIIGTLTMIVMEKSREIAILKSMGATRNSIMKIFMFSGVFIGVVGTVLGSTIGYGAVAVIARSGLITLPKDVYQVSHLPLSITGFDILFISLTALGISFAATIYPAWQAAPRIRWKCCGMSRGQAVGTMLRRERSSYGYGHEARFGYVVRRSCF